MEDKKHDSILELMKNIFAYFAIWLVLFVVISFSTTEMTFADCYIISLLWAWPVWSILVKRIDQ